MQLQLKKIRKEKKITQTEMAKLLGVDARTIGNWELGKTMMNAEQVWNCAVALGCEPNDVMGWWLEHARPAAAAAPPGLSGSESELVSLYRTCTADRRRRTLDDLRDRAAMSGEMEEAGAPDVPTRERMTG